MSAGRVSQDNDTLISTSVGIIASLSFGAFLLCCLCCTIVRLRTTAKRRIAAARAAETARLANKVAPETILARKRMADLLARQKKAKGVPGAPPISPEELAELKKMVASGEITQEEFEVALSGSGLTLAELEALSAVHKKHRRKRPRAGRARVEKFFDKGGRMGKNMRWDKVSSHMGADPRVVAMANPTKPTKQAWS